MDAQVLLDRAEARLKEGDPTGARRDFEAALHLDPSDYTPYYGIARSYEALGQDARAVVAYESLLVVGERRRWRLSERILALRSEGTVCYRLGDLNLAAQALAKLHASGGSSLPMDMRLALAYALGGQPDAAVRLHAEMLRRYGAIEAVWRLAFVLHAGECAPGARGLADLFCGLRRPQPKAEAVRSEVRAAQSRGECPGLSWLVLGEGELDAGNLDDSERAFTSVGDGPLAPFATFMLGNIELRRGNAAAALRAFQSAGAVSDIPPETLHYHTGRALHRLGRIDEAEVAARKASLDNPLSARSSMLWATIESERGEREAAERAYRRALDIDPQQAEAAFQLGALLVAGGRAGEGKVFLQRCLELDPKGEHAGDARRLMVSPSR